MLILNELLLSRLIRALTWRRILNILKTSTSFLLSVFLNRPIVWGIPPVLTIEPTNQCNLHCPLCTTGSGEMERPGGRMSLQTYQKMISLLGDDIFFLLIYHQGEPYMNKHFFEFIKLAKQKNIYVTSSTNGHYFTQQNIEKTLDSGLDSMIVSIDGVTQESYQTYRIGGQLERVLEGTKNLLVERKRRGQRTPNVAFQFLVMQHNEDEIPQIKNLAEEIGVDRLLIKNIEVQSLEEADKWLPVNNKYRRYNYDGQEFIVKGAEKKYCSRPWLSTLINWDGTFVPCCFDKNAQYPMGNLHQINEINDAWKAEKFTQFRQEILNNRAGIDICRNCNQGFGSFLPHRFWKSSRNNKLNHSD